MNKAQHTPTLEIGQTMTIQGDETRTIKADGLIVAFVSDGNLKDTTQRDALAERIVRAVNAHDPLIKILQKTSELLGKRIDYTEQQAIRGLIGDTLKAITNAGECR